MARPRKLTADVQRRLCDALAAGNTRRAACAFAGISEDSVARYRDRFADFADAIQKAEADAEVRNVAIVTRAAQSGVWQAAAWWLERRFPHDYGRTIQEQHLSGTVVQEHTGSLEVRALDYRQAIRPLRPPELEEAAG